MPITSPTWVPFACRFPEPEKRRNAAPPFGAPANAGRSAQIATIVTRRRHFKVSCSADRALLEHLFGAGDHLRLFNRGNGASRGSIQAVNATVEVSWSEFVPWLQRGLPAARPQLWNATQYVLGDSHGQRLGFTDATVAAARLLFSAAAEDSPDAVRDGRITGSAIGVFDGDELRWIELRDPSGNLVPLKVEGLCTHGAAADRVSVVVDVDDPRAPSELCEVELGGAWGF